MTALRPGTSPPPVRMPMRLLTMPTSQNWHVVIIGGPLAIRHRRAAKARKIAMGIIADRAPLGAKPTSGSAARGHGFGEELRRTPSYDWRTYRSPTGGLIDRSVESPRDPASSPGMSRRFLS